MGQWSMNKEAAWSGLLPLAVRPDSVVEGGGWVEKGSLPLCFIIFAGR